MSILEIVTRIRPPMKPKKVLLAETLDAFNRIEAQLVTLHLWAEKLDTKLNRILERLQDPRNDRHS